jgi:hypothetical protein
VLIELAGEQPGPPTKYCRNDHPIHVPWTQGARLSCHGQAPRWAADRGAKTQRRSPRIEHSSGSHDDLRVIAIVSLYIQKLALSKSVEILALCLQKSHCIGGLFCSMWLLLDVASHFESL